MGRHADDDAGRAPFLNKSRDRIVVYTTVAISDYTEWAGGSRYVLTNGNADAAKSEIESKDCSGC